METKYSGYTIKYNEETSKFEVALPDGVIGRDTLAGVKSYIDKLGDENVKQKQQKALYIYDYRASNPEVKEATIGTFGRLKSGWRRGVYVWITKIGYRGRKERVRESVSSYGHSIDFYHDTAGNRKILQSMVDKLKALKDFEVKTNDEVAKLKSKLDEEVVKQLVKDEELPVWDR